MLEAHQGWPVKLIKLPPGPAGLGPWPGFPRNPPRRVSGLNSFDGKCALPELGDPGAQGKGA